jgi:hypothetical protein
MEGIVIESVRLIAADKESDSIINQLRSDGIFSLDNSPYVPLNIVLVSTKEGSQKVLQLLALKEKANKNVVMLMDSELQIPEEANVDSVLSFSNELGFYKDFKNFLLLIRHNVDLPSNICFDFNDFFMMIKGRRALTIHSYRYKENIIEAVSNLRNILLLKEARYLLFFTVEHYDQKQLREQLDALANYMGEFPDEVYLWWNFTESQSKEVTLLISKQV